MSARSNNARMSRCLFYTVALNLGKMKRVQVLSLVCAKNKRFEKMVRILGLLYIFEGLSLSLCFQLAMAFQAYPQLCYSPPVAESNNQRQDGQQGAQPVPEAAAAQSQSVSPPAGSMVEETGRESFEFAGFQHPHHQAPPQGRWNLVNCLLSSWTSISLLLNSFSSLRIAALSAGVNLVQGLSARRS